MPVVISGGGVVSGRYRLERRLDEDAAAVTWHAYDMPLERRVRLKLLRPEALTDGHAAEAFRRDARRAARATEPAAKVLDGGDDSATGLPFVVYEWLLTAVDDSPTQRIVRPRRGPGAERLVVAVLLTIPLVVGVALLAQWLSQPESTVSTVFSLPRATPAPATEVAPTSARAATATPVPPRPTATPVPETGERRRVANTDGIGVALRDGPDGQRLPGKGYDEGDVVTLLEQRGRWARIRGDDGREGWVLAVTLVR